MVRKSRFCSQTGTCWSANKPFSGHLAPQRIAENQFLEYSSYIEWQSPEMSGIQHQDAAYISYIFWDKLHGSYGPYSIIIPKMWTMRSTFMGQHSKHSIKHLNICSFIPEFINIKWPYLQFPGDENLTLQTVQTENMEPSKC